MSIKHTLNVLISKALTNKSIKHSCNISLEYCSNILPKNRVLTVIYIRAIIQIVIFKPIAKVQRTDIINTKRSITIVGEEEPMYSVKRSNKLVLCSAINHKENVCENIIKQSEVFLEIILKLCLKFSKSITCAISRISCTINSNTRNRITSCRIRICTCNPTYHSL